MAIVNILMSVATIIIYFFLSLFLPFLNYLIPYYKITKVNLYKKKYSILINILVSLVLFFINSNLLIIYLFFPYMMEFLFYFFNKAGRGIKVYNRVVIMSMITTILLFAYFFINRDMIITLINVLPQLEEVKTLGIEKVQKIQELLIYFDKYALLAIFQSVFLANLFLFLTLIPDTYKMWKISCYWLIPFILILWGQSFLNIPHNLFLENNILKIIEYIFLWYGIKNIYSLTEKVGIKSNILKHGISIILGLTYPTITFLIGALASFEVIEIRKIRI